MIQEYLSSELFILPLEKLEENSNKFEAPYSFDISPVVSPPSPKKPQ
jgi:hypothetical protein